MEFLFLERLPTIAAYPAVDVWTCRLRIYYYLTMSHREVFGAGGGEVEAGDGAAGGEGSVGGDFYV